jgi:hypothetical protein
MLECDFGLRRPHFLCEAPSMNRVSSFRFSLLVSLILVPLVLVGTSAGQANVTGQWNTLPNLMPINPVHAALMHNGKVLVVSGSGNYPPNLTSNILKATVWDPFANTFNTQDVGWDMFCNGMVVLPDGRPFINGGTLQYDPFHGELSNAVFDPATSTFTNVQNMAHGRWYPTPTVLGDGRVMTFSGLDENGATNLTTEIYTPNSGWSAPVTAPFTPPLYPRMHVLPNGRVFYSGSGTTSRIFNPATGGWNIVATTKYGSSRTYGTSVLLPLTPANNYAPKVLILGGGNPSTATTELIDLSVATPAWGPAPDMSQPRIEMGATILPNGKVLATGGSYNDEDATTKSLNADLYDPATNTMALAGAGANAYARLYHSVALLLPDATVWLAGGNPSRGTYQQHMEIYKPAYLFTTDGSGSVIPATRPSISSAPTSIIGYGSTFTVQTPDAIDISQAVLMRPGSPTHAFDQEQRLVGMSFTSGAESLTVTAPPNGNIAPPGYYMLFLLNSAGVPSVASFVQLGTAAPTPDFSVGATPSSQSVPQGSAANYNVTITASGGFSSNVGFSVTGLPTGASATFTPTSIGGSGTSVMNVSTLASTAAGTYALTITATSGTLVHTASATLVVTAPTNFSIAVSPASQTIRSNSSTKYTVTITGTNGFSGSVQLSVAGLPSRTNSSFTPNPVVGSGTSSLSIKALPKSNAGTYPLTITGTSGGLVHSTSATLVIQ